MEWDAFKALVNKTINSNEALMAFVKCKIQYSGRAEAELDWGDRMLIIKQDNCLLIHQPENGNPINYLKPGSSIKVQTTDYLLIEAYNQQSKDQLLIEIDDVHDAMNMKLEDGKKQVLAGTEAEMSDMIKENPQLISKDFKPLSREEHTKYGFIDVFGHDKNGTLMIVECKRYTAGLSAVQQLRRYVERIKKMKGIKKVRGILAAPTITANAKQMLEDWKFEFVAVEPPKRLENYKKGQKSLAEW